MVDAHTGMNISSEEFDVIVELLGKTLLEMGVSTDLVNEIAVACEPLRKDIILKWGCFRICYKLRNIFEIYVCLSITL